MARSARWAGQFYSSDAGELKRELEAMLSVWPGRSGEPWALIVPHAGYVYSGRTAAAAYSFLSGREVQRILLIGPSHHQAVDGFGLSLEEAWETPLGRMPVDLEGARTLLDSGLPFGLAESAMAREHSLEVQLPFIQNSLSSTRLLPVIMGAADAEERRRARQQFRALAAPGDLWLITTDLSHFHGRNQAERLDGEAERLIAGGKVEPFLAALAGGKVEACGAGPVLLLLEEAEERGSRVEILDRSDSADASGDESSVVGYLAAAAVWE